MSSEETETVAEEAENATTSPTPYVRKQTCPPYSKAVSYIEDLFSSNYPKNLKFRIAGGTKVVNLNGSITYGTKKNTPIIATLSAKSKTTPVGFSVEYTPQKLSIGNKYSYDNSTLDTSFYQLPSKAIGVNYTFTRDFSPQIQFRQSATLVSNPKFKQSFQLKLDLKNFEKVWASIQCTFERFLPTNPTKFSLLTKLCYSADPFLFGCSLTSKCQFPYYFSQPSDPGFEFFVQHKTTQNITTTAVLDPIKDKIDIYVGSQLFNSKNTFFGLKAQVLEVFNRSLSSGVISLAFVLQHKLDKGKIQAKLCPDGSMGLSFSANPGKNISFSASFLPDITKQTYQWGMSTSVTL